MMACNDHQQHWSQSSTITLSMKGVLTVAESCSYCSLAVTKALQMTKASHLRKKLFTMLESTFYGRRVH